MKRFLTFPRLSLLFLALFGLSVAGVFVLQTYWLDPGKRCEAGQLMSVAKGLHVEIIVSLWRSRSTGIDLAIRSTETPSKVVQRSQTFKALASGGPTERCNLPCRSTSTM